MQKCQHGIKISIFCIYDNCSVKQSAGCQICFKKYHNHVGVIQSLKIQQIDQLVNKFCVENSIKPKCRAFQQVIINFFNQIKNQINNSIDIICKSIVNRIGYPFLSYLNHLSSFKKIKNKEYKRINSKQLRNFYQQANQISQTQVINKERELYFKQINQNFQIISKLQEIMKVYEQQVKRLCKNFKHDSSSFKKIEDLKLNVQQFLTIQQNKKNISQVNLLQVKVQVQKNDKQLQMNIKNQPAESLKNSNYLFSPNDRLQNKFKVISINSSPKQQIKINDQSIRSQIQKEKKQNSNNNKNKFRTIRNSSMQVERKNNINTQFIETQNLHYQSKEKQITLRKQKLIQMLSFKEKINLKNNIPIIKINSPLEKGQNNQTKKQVYLNNSLMPKNLQKSDSICSFINSNNFKKQMIDSCIKPNQFPKYPQLDLKIDDPYKYGITKFPSFCSNSQLQEMNFDFLASKKKTSTNTIQISNQNKKIDSTSSTNQQTPKPNDKLGKSNQHELQSTALYFKALQCKNEEALKYLKASLKYSRLNLSASEYLSFIYLQQNKQKQCLNLCNQTLNILSYLKCDKKLRQVFLINKSAALNKLGRYSQVVTLLDKQAIYFQNSKLYKNLADAYLSIGIYEKCQYNYQKALYYNPSFDQAMYNMAVSLFFQSSYHNAKLFIQKALKINPHKNQYIQFKQQVDLILKDIFNGKLQNQ